MSKFLKSPKAKRALLQQTNAFLDVLAPIDDAIIPHQMKVKRENIHESIEVEKKVDVNARRKLT